MPAMRHTLLVILLVGCLGLCQAQAQTTAIPAPMRETSLPGAGIEKRTERILIEDVQPKGGAPRYQIQPTSGERSWNVLAF